VCKAESSGGPQRRVLFLDAQHVCSGHVATHTHSHTHTHTHTHTLTHTHTHTGDVLCVKLIYALSYSQTGALHVRRRSRWSAPSSPLASPLHHQVDGDKHTFMFQLYTLISE